MKEFKVIYKILKTLRDGMYSDDFDIHTIYPDKLGISENQWAYIIKMLSDEGYVEDLYVRIGVDGYISFGTGPHPRVTHKGLKYLDDNTMMKRAYRFFKAVKDIIPKP